MEAILSLIVALLPIFLIGLFIYKHDKAKESTKLLVSLFVGGIISCFPAVYLEMYVSNFFPEEQYMSFIQLFMYVFIGIAFVEELCKWFFVYSISYDHNEFDTLYDMVVYASFVALGFACFENVLYVLSNGIMTGVMRAISAVPGHVCDGILMGSYLSLAKMNQVRGNYQLSQKYKILSLVIPTVTHGIYDFCLFTGNLFFIGVFVIFVIAVFVICFKKVKKISKNDIKFIYKYSYCPTCGTPVSGNFCCKCGKKHS